MNPSLADLREDLGALAALAESCGARVWEFRGFFESTDPHLNDESERLWNAAQEVVTSLRRELNRADNWSDGDLAGLIALKAAAANRMRILHGQLGFVLSAGDWQSPSFDASLRPQAGKQEGRIIGTQNDYKRDIHLDAEAYEQAFRKAYIDAPLRLPPEIHVTSSGMSAFTTLIELLRLQDRLRGPVLVGTGCYFQNRWILERAFPGQTHLVDEMDTDAVLAEARRLRPAAVFLDTLCNTEAVAIPNLPLLLPALAKELDKRACLVLDNSGLGCSFQPFRYLPRILAPRLFVVESLNKHHQFGMDRVTGGVVWTNGGVLPSGLMKTREHIGTIMPDASVLALPWPNRARLDARLSRIGRNALALAARLDAFAASHPNSPVSHVVYPGLPSHPAHSWAKDLSFCGASLVLAFKPKYANPSAYQSLLKQAIAQARRDKVQLVAGTSFGLDTTRLYLTALYATNIAKPFLRVSAGTETAVEVEKIGDVLERTIRGF